MHRLSLYCLTLFACAGCPPTPPQPGPGVPDAAVTTTDAAPPAPPPIDASSGAVGAACANLKGVGCKEGADPACEVAISKAVAGRVTTIDLHCLTVAKDKAAVHSCGNFVACP